jgi:hypothetical protein
LAKLGLSLLAMSFDILFIVQHYVLYTSREGKYQNEGEEGDEDERQPILTNQQDGVH